MTTMVHELGWARRVVDTEYEWTPYESGFGESRQETPAGSQIQTSESIEAAGKFLETRKRIPSHERLAGTCGLKNCR